MKNSQLLEILRPLSKTEFRDFGKFVRSPYHNNRSEVIRFYDAIKKFYPEFHSKDFTEEKIFPAVYPGKKYSGVLMRKLVSLATNLVLDFLMISGLKKDSLEYNIKLADMLREKKLPALFEKKVKTIDELFLKSKRPFSYYESKYKYTSILNGYFLNSNEKSMISKLQNEIDDFIQYFLSVSLLLYIRLGEWSRGYNVKFDLKFQDEVINYISSHNHGDVTLASLYYNMLMLLSTEEEKYFFALQKCRDEFESKLADIDDYNVGIVSMQYCHKRVQKGDTEYRKHQFNITNIIIKKNLMPAGYIEPYFFTNIIRNASNIKELKWSEEFINNFKDRLYPEFAEEITNYSFAMVEFGKENYEKSLNYLSKINIERSNMKFDIKNLQIVIYYELNYTEELISLIDAYKHFLQRDKSVSEPSKKIGLVFVNFTSDLIRIKLSTKKDSVMKLKKDIEDAPYFTLKDWLIKKAAELRAS